VRTAQRGENPSQLDGGTAFKGTCGADGKKCRGAALFQESPTDRDMGGPEAAKGESLRKKSRKGRSAIGGLYGASSLWSRKKGARSGTAH